MYDLNNISCQAVTFQFENLLSAILPHTDGKRMGKP